ncbi:hypothetical protein OSTOST_04657 [Ostertagia ostertagi]
MVFCSLLEYAAVGYINKRMKLQAKKKEDNRDSGTSSLMMMKAVRVHRRFTWKCLLRPSNIDKYSRWSFPALFILFNVGYWSYFLRISHNDAVLNTDF